MQRINLNKIMTRKKIIFMCIFSFVAIAFYLQLTFNSERFTKTDFAQNETVKDVLGSNKATYADSKDSLENDFFSRAKLDREIASEQRKELAKELLTSTEASADEKQEALTQISMLARNVELENKIEALVKEKGYKDAFAAIAEDGSIDMVVRADELNKIEVASIADIASRQAKTPMEMIHIKNKN